jgi:transposase
MIRFQSLTKEAREEKRQEIIELAVTTRMSYPEVAKKTDVGVRTVEYIMAKFAKETNAPEQMKKQKTNPTPEDYAALQAEITRLQKDLRHEKMRADVYSTMVDVAEEMFHIQIRKKAGTK